LINDISLFIKNNNNNSNNGGVMLPTNHLPQTLEVEEVNNMGTKRWNPRIHNSWWYYGCL